jgi:hypothetical protein
MFNLKYNGVNYDCFLFLLLGPSTSSHLLSVTHRLFTTHAMLGQHANIALALFIAAFQPYADMMEQVNKTKQTSQNIFAMFECLFFLYI